MLFGLFIFEYGKLGLLHKGVHKLFEGVHNFYLRVFTIFFKVYNIYIYKKIYPLILKSQGVQLANYTPSLEHGAATARSNGL